MSYIITYGDDQQFQAIMFLLQTAQGMSAGDPRRAGIIRQLDRLEKDVPFDPWQARRYYDLKKAVFGSDIQLAPEVSLNDTGEATKAGSSDNFPLLPVLAAGALLLLLMRNASV